MYQAWKRKSCAKGCRIKHWTLSLTQVLTREAKDKVSQAGKRDVTPAVFLISAHLIQRNSPAETCLQWQQVPSWCLPVVNCRGQSVVFPSNCCWAALPCGRCLVASFALKMWWNQVATQDRLRKWLSKVLRWGLLQRSAVKERKQLHAVANANHWPLASTVSTS